MKELQITIEEAAEIFKDRFNYGTPRSEAYKRGFRDRVQKVATGGKHVPSRPYPPGSPHFDAYGAGFEHALNSMEVWVMRREEAAEEAELLVRSEG